MFCSATPNIDGEYDAAASEFGKYLGEGGHCFVYGGTENGLMGILSRSTQKHGGTTLGFVPDNLWQYARPTDIKVGDLHERLAVMTHNSDAFAALVGGIGTVHEVVDIIAAKQLGIIEHPLVLINTKGRYTLFGDFFLGLEDDGFIRESSVSYYSLAENPKEAYDFLMEHLGSSSQFGCEKT